MPRQAAMMDRLALLRGPGGELSVGLITEWDTPADADEFAAAAMAAIGNLSTSWALDSAQYPGGSTRVLIALGDDADAVLDALMH